jgi:sarcosine oxidase gamma subunit
MLAPDEWLLIGDEAGNALASSDQHVVDFSSGLVCLELSGPAREEAFACLSDLELPADRPTFVQGIVADVPTKVVVGDGVLSLYVPPTFAHHVRHEISRLQRLSWTAWEVAPERALA